MRKTQRCIHRSRGRVFQVEETQVWTSLACLRNRKGRRRERDGVWTNALRANLAPGWTADWHSPSLSQSLRWDRGQSIKDLRECGTRAWSATLHSPFLLEAPLVHVKGPCAVVGKLRSPKPDGPSLRPEQFTQLLCASGFSFENWDNNDSPQIHKVILSIRSVHTIRAMLSQCLLLLLSQRQETVPLPHTLFKRKKCAPAPSLAGGLLWRGLSVVVDCFLPPHNALDRMLFFCFHHQKSILSAYLCGLLCWAGSGDTGQMWPCPLREFHNLTQTSQRLREIKDTQTVSRRWITVISGTRKRCMLKSG